MYRNATEVVKLYNSRAVSFENGEQADYSLVTTGVARGGRGEGASAPQSKGWQKIFHPFSLKGP